MSVGEVLEEIRGGMDLLVLHQSESCLFLLIPLNPFPPCTYPPVIIVTLEDC